MSVFMFTHNRPRVHILVQFTEYQPFIFLHDSFHITLTDHAFTIFTVHSDCLSALINQLIEFAFFNHTIHQLAHTTNKPFESLTNFAKYGRLTINSENSVQLYIFDFITFTTYVPIYLRQIVNIATTTYITLI